MRPGSSGLPVPGYEGAIVDDEGQPVAPGEIGNLRVRGDSIMAYYWNQHEKTGDALSAPGSRPATSTTRTRTATSGTTGAATTC